jgi:hypothetical protein
MDGLDLLCVIYNAETLSLSHFSGFSLISPLHSLGLLRRRLLTWILCRRRLFLSAVSSVVTSPPSTFSFTVASLVFPLYPLSASPSLPSLHFGPFNSLVGFRPPSSLHSFLCRSVVASISSCSQLHTPIVRC